MTNQANQEPNLAQNPNVLQETDVDMQDFIAGQVGALDTAIHQTGNRDHRQYGLVRDDAPYGQQYPPVSEFVRHGTHPNSIYTSFGREPSFVPAPEDNRGFPVPQGSAELSIIRMQTDKGAVVSTTIRPPEDITKTTVYFEDTGGNQRIMQLGSRRVAKKVLEGTVSKLGSPSKGSKAA